MSSVAAIDLTCVVCGATWTMERRRGQYPRACAACAKRRNVPCIDCGRRRVFQSSRRKIPERCGACGLKHRQAEEVRARAAAERVALLERAAELGLTVLDDTAPIVVDAGARGTAVITSRADLAWVARDLELDSNTTRNA